MSLYNCSTYFSYLLPFPLLFSSPSPTSHPGWYPPNSLPPLNHATVLPLLIAYTLPPHPCQLPRLVPTYFSSISPNKHVTILPLLTAYTPPHPLQSPGLTPIYFSSTSPPHRVASLPHPLPITQVDTHLIPFNHVTVLPLLIAYTPPHPLQSPRLTPTYFSSISPPHHYVTVLPLLLVYTPPSFPPITQQVDTHLFLFPLST